MNRIETKIPVEYYLYKRSCLEAELAKYPVIRSGTHENRRILRVYSSKEQEANDTSLSSTRYREISPKSSNWKRAEQIYNRRSELATQIREIDNILKTCYKGTPRPSNITLTDYSSKYNNKYFDSLKDQSCTLENTNQYRYNGRNYRSRFEMEFASQLDAFGLEFKYDVQLKFNGRLYTVDFVIVFREFDRCVFFEFLGKSQDNGYNRKNGDKIADANTDGVYFGRDLFILSGDDAFMPGPEAVQGMIVGIVAQVTTQHLAAAD